VTSDPSTALLRRLEGGAIVWTVLTIGIVLVAAPSRIDVMLAIAGGGLLSIASFYAIRASVDAVMLAARPADPSASGAADDAGAPRPGRVGVVVKLTGRYALLGLLAYVMIARLRLHPLGLLVGITALAASATVEAVRGLGRGVGPRGVGPPRVGPGGVGPSGRPS
jgi:hypothetical protein